MKGRRLFCIAAIFCFVLTACSAGYESSMADMETFDTVSDLIRHIQSKPSLKEKIMDSYPDEMSIRVYMPKENPFGSKLYSVERMDSTITFKYYLNGYEPAKSSYPSEPEYSASQESSAASDNNASECRMRQQEIDYFNNTLSVGWNFVTYNGSEEFLAGAGNYVKELPDYPEVYFVQWNNESEILYWGQENYRFMAEIPAQYVDDLLWQTNGLKDFMVPVIYSTQTFERLK